MDARTSLEERRQRADAAWQRVMLDAKYLTEVVEVELARVKDVGLRKMVEAIHVKQLFARYPIAFVGAAAGVGLVAGWRGGRRRATLAAIASGALASVPPSQGGAGLAPGKSFGRKLFEAAFLAALQQGAQAAASRAVHAIESRDR
jgi:hypothetical protein